MPYQLGDRVELLYKGEWYRGTVWGEDVLSKDGNPCIKIAFNPNDPTGKSTQGLGYILIPNDEIDALIRHESLAAYHDSLRVDKSAGFKNSVNIRF